MRTDRRTEMTKLIVACHNFAKAPNKIYLYAYTANNICWDGKVHDLYSEVTLCSLRRNTDCSYVFCATSLFLQTNAGLLYTIPYSMEHSPWEANWFSTSQEIPGTYGTRMFITAFTSARHLPPSWARPIQYMPPPPSHSLKIQLNIILPSTPGSSK